MYFYFICILRYFTMTFLLKCSHFQLNLHNFIYVCTIKFYPLWTGRGVKKNRLAVCSMRVVGGDWMVQGTGVGSWGPAPSFFLFFLFCFPFCSSSPMSSSVVLDGVGCFTVCASIPFLFFTLLTCLSLALMPADSAVAESRFSYNKNKII